MELEGKIIFIEFPRPHLMYVLGNILYRYDKDADEPEILDIDVSVDKISSIEEDVILLDTEGNIIILSNYNVSVTLKGGIVDMLQVDSNRIMLLDRDMKIYIIIRSKYHTFETKLWTSRFCGIVNPSPYGRLWKHHDKPHLIDANQMAYEITEQWFSGYKINKLPIQDLQHNMLFLAGLRMNLEQDGIFNVDEEKLLDDVALFRSQKVGSKHFIHLVKTTGQAYMAKILHDRHYTDEDDVDLFFKVQGTDEVADILCFQTNSTWIIGICVDLDMNLFVINGQYQTKSLPINFQQRLLKRALHEI